MPIFLSPPGKYEPCGMFTPSHFIATAICIALIIVAFIIFRKCFNEKVRTFSYKILAILLTVLESVKIAHSFLSGNTHLDAWVPISYCSLFIYAVWMAGFGKSFIKRAGEAYISYGCPIAGLAFLILPTTSLMNYPIWHFLSLYSMLFHSLMIFFGIISLTNESKLDLKTYFSYIAMLVFFAIPAIALNITQHSNLMNLREPHNIPMQFLQNLYQNSQAGYTALLLFAYMLMPAVVGFFGRKIKFKK